MEVDIEIVVVDKMDVDDEMVHDKIVEAEDTFVKREEVVDVENVYDILGEGKMVLHSLIYDKGYEK